ncbi:hypothetical protein [Caudoviricetes sp.]|nr:hypothetical protein [Caudoviricetes sp.]
MKEYYYAFLFEARRGYKMLQTLLSFTFSIHFIDNSGELHARNTKNTRG